MAVVRTMRVSLIPFLMYSIPAHPLGTLAGAGAPKGEREQPAYYPPLLRLGSGALPGPPGHLPLPGGHVEPQPADTGAVPLPRSPYGVFVVSRLLPITIIAFLFYMMAAGAGPPTLTGRDNFNYRIPPSWSPEHETSYSFRAYMTDISLWIMLTDLQPHQQCAAIIMRLGGAAREMARMITPQEMAQGGVLNGIAVDPVTYLLSALHARFAALEEESRLTSMIEMLAFARRPGETINALLARYETVRQRAAVEGQFVMSMEGCSLQILRACGIQSQHLFTLLQPFGGRLPQTDAQFREMCTQLRRYGHISEGASGNIATALHGPLRQARPNTYLAQQGQDPQGQSDPSSPVPAYFGN